MSRLAALGNALKLPFLRFGRYYNETAEKWPMGTGVVTTVVKTSAADLFAQKVVEKREDVDWRRHAMFCGFGLTYLGCFQFWLYNVVFPVWCKPLTMAVGHLGAAPIKVLIDQGLHHPFIYFPSFYALKGAVEGRPVSKSLEKCRDEMWTNLKALWMIWVPAQLVNFAVVPMHLRIPFVAGVSFAWTVVISVMRGTLEDTTAPTAPTQQANDAAGAGSTCDGGSAGAAGSAASSALSGVGGVAHAAAAATAAVAATAVASGARGFPIGTAYASRHE